MTEKPGSEVGRDEKRNDPKPKQHGRDWNEPVKDDRRPASSEDGEQGGEQIESGGSREKTEAPKSGQ